MKRFCFIVISLALSVIFLHPTPVFAEDPPSYLTSWGTTGTGNGQFNTPTWIKVDTQNNVYVSDLGNKRIQKFDSNGNFLTKWGSAGSANGQFNYIYGFVIDSADNIYVLDVSRIQKFDANGTHLATWANYFEDPNNPSTCPYATPEECEFWLYLPPALSIMAISIDSNDNIYLSSDIGDGLVYKVNTSGVLQESFTLLDGWTPGKAAFDANTNLYSTTSQPGVGSIFCPIKKHNASHQFVSTFINCEADFYGEEMGGPAPPGLFYGVLNGTPYDFHIKGNNMYVVHSTNSQIVKFNLSGVVQSYWGTSGSSVGQFNFPYGVTVDSNDNVYVTEYLGNRIQKFGTVILDHTVSYSVIPSQVGVAGTISGSNNQSVAHAGTAMEVRAVPVRGYAFLQWSDGSIQNPRQDTNVTTDISLTAEFVSVYTVNNPYPGVMTASVNRGFLTPEAPDPTTTNAFTFNIGFEFVSNNAKVVVPSETVVNDKNSSNFDLTTFTITDPAPDLSGLQSGPAGSVKIGVSDHKLSFSKDITVTIPVSPTYNGQNMSILYRLEGESEWKKESSCQISEGKCTFTTNHATSFAVVNLPSANTCTDTKPVGKPDLFQIETSNNSAKIFFTPVSDGNKYFISYSTNSNAEEHGLEVQLSNTGVQSYTINLLKPNTTYYLRVRSQNGCTPGDWGNIISAKTANTKTKLLSTYYKSAKAKVSSLAKKVFKTTKPVTENTPPQAPTITTEPTPQTTPISNLATPKTNPTQTKPPQKKCYLFNRWFCF